MGFPDAIPSLFVDAQQLPAECHRALRLCELSEWTGCSKGCFYPFYAFIFVYPLPDSALSVFSFPGKAMQ